MRGMRLASSYCFSRGLCYIFFLRRFREKDATKCEHCNCNARKDSPHVFIASTTIVIGSMPAAKHGRGFCTSSYSG